MQDTLSRRVLNLGVDVREESDRAYLVRCVVGHQIHPVDSVLPVSISITMHAPRVSRRDINAGKRRV